MLTLTPAYDICPQSRAGNEASQAMLIVGNERMSQLSACRRAAANFLLTPARADEIIEEQLRSIRASWREACDEAELGEVDRNLMWRRQVLTPYALEDLPKSPERCGILTTHFLGQGH